jgi:hypothetical protein
VFLVDDCKLGICAKRGAVEAPPAPFRRQTCVKFKVEAGIGVYLLFSEDPDEEARKPSANVDDAAKVRRARSDHSGRETITRLAVALAARRTPLPFSPHPTSHSKNWRRWKIIQI